MGDDSDTIKKTVDLPKSDKEFVEEEINNFSHLVRRMIGLEKYYRTDRYDMEELEEQLRKIAEIGEEVRDEWREEQEEVLEEYDAEIAEENRQGIHYIREHEDGLDGEGKYSVDWGGNDVIHWQDQKERTEEAKELGHKLAKQWMDATTRYSDRIEEHTDFKQWSGDEHTMFFEAKEDSEMEGLEIGTRYVARSLGQIDVTMAESDRNYRAKLLVNYRAVY